VALDRLLGGDALETGNPLWCGQASVALDRLLGGEAPGTGHFCVDRPSPWTDSSTRVPACQACVNICDQVLSYLAVNGLATRGSRLLGHFPGT
jgi:hypothetical protein